MSRFNKPKVVVIGGGTGNFVLLQGIKTLNIDLKVIVNMSDDGGSSGILRDELGVLPPGDVRQCLVALSDTNEIRNLFNYRFNKGSFAGQSLGNIILSGLELEYNDFNQAIQITSKLLNIKGKVLPVTLTKHNLVLKDGKKKITGEYKISTLKEISNQALLSFTKQPKINPEAIEAINQADWLIIAPGNLYGTLLPIFSIKKMSNLIKKSKAKIILIANLINKPGQTTNWSILDYVQKIEQYISKNRIDYILYNKQKIPEYLLNKYASESEYPVLFDQKSSAQIKTQLIGANLLDSKIHQPSKGDTLIPRTLIRHSSKSLKNEISRLILNI